MKFTYDVETDQLYIKLREGKVHEGEDIAEGFVAHFDEAGAMLALEIEHASQRVNLDIENITIIPAPTAA